jgi:SAM-dependent methyltransferase
MVEQVLQPSGVALPRENVYGHVQRLDWIRDRLRAEDRAVEFGCGTGLMLTLPLRVSGYDVTGVDIDRVSVDYGRKVLKRAGVGAEALAAQDLEEVAGGLDAVIASEVLEHLDDEQLTEVLALIYSKLRPGGRILVTVPNGYGLFELESFLWFRCGFDRLYHRRRVNMLIWHLRKSRFGDYVDSPYPSTLADSPHKQRFTLRSIQRTLERAGFRVAESRGSVLVAGPFSSLVFTGWDRAMALNARLGQRLPRVAAGFYLVGDKPA